MGKGGDKKMDKNILMGANALVIIGGLAWGAKALNMDIVPMITGAALAPIVYGLVGISAALLGAKELKMI
jgi:uncharacterized membrane protein YuzA (DUF378 family)